MAVCDLIQQARTRFGQASSALLRADETTGEKPWEMFITDEHTEHYLALKSGGDTDRGMLTGAVGGTGGLVMIMFSLVFALQGDTSDALFTLLLTTSIVLPVFL